MTRPGEIVLDDATRTFNVRADRSRTLKELLVNRGHASDATVVRAVDDVTLTLQPGQAMEMVGRNGAGKTSRLRCWTDDPDPALVAELLELVVHDDALRGEFLSRGRARLDEYSPERTAEKVRAAVDAVIAR